MCGRRGREARALPGSRRRRLSQLGPQPNPTGMQRGHMTSGGRATPFPLQGHPAPSCTDAVTKAGTSCSPLARSPLLSAQPRYCLGRESPGLVLLSFSPALQGRPARGVLPDAGIMAPVFSLCLPRQLPTLPSCGCPCCRMMSAPANQGAPGHPGRPGHWLRCRSRPPPDSASAAVRCGAAAKAQVRGGEWEKKKTLHKKPTTKPTKTPAAISRNNRQNPSEQPQPSALRRERERNKRHTHRRVRQEKNTHRLRHDHKTFNHPPLLPQT